MAAPTFFVAPGNDASLQLPWESAAPEGTFRYEQDFESLPGNPFPVGPVAVNAVETSSGNPLGLFFLSNFGQAPNTTNGWTLLCNSASGTLTFSEPVVGFGLWIFEDGGGLFSTYTMTVNGVTSPALDPGVPGYSVAGFLGVIDPAGISQIELDGAGIAFEMDRLQILSSTTAAPEPMPVGLMALGLVAGAPLARRRSKLMR